MRHVSYRYVILKNLRKNLKKYEKIVLIIFPRSAYKIYCQGAKAGFNWGYNGGH